MHIISVINACFANDFSLLFFFLLIPNVNDNSTALVAFEGNFDFLDRFLKPNNVKIKSIYVAHIARLVDTVSQTHQISQLRASATTSDRQPI